MKNVFVTGGSGFLGRQIVKYTSDKHNVFAPRRNECDLFDLDSIVNFFNKCRTANSSIDTVISSAAYYGGLNITVSEPATIFYKNVQMINNLFEAARIAGVKKIIVVGSACAYPGNVDGDMKETDFWSGPLHDSVMAYGFTKKIQLVAQNAYYNQHGIEGNHLVITNLYGPHDVYNEYRGHAIAVLIKRYVDAALENKGSVTNWGNGSAIREFLFVEDAGRIIANSIDWEHDLEPVNVGTGIGTSIKELTEYIAEFSKYQGKVEWDSTKPNGVPRKVLDISKLKNLMPGFVPVPLSEGLKKTIDWYSANKEEADNRF